MADNLLKRFSNATVGPNGNLCWRVETRSGVLDVEGTKADVMDLFTFLVHLAAAAPLAPVKGLAAPQQEDFASFPLHKIGLQPGPGAGEFTLLIQTSGQINMGFRLPAAELERFAETVSQLAQSQKR
jgi:hypothetical protein